MRFLPSIPGILLFVCGLVISIGCGQRSSPNGDSLEPEDTAATESVPQDTLTTLPESGLSPGQLARLNDLGSVGIWGSQWDDEQGTSIGLVDSLADTTSVATLVARFNARFPTDKYPGLRLTKIENGIPHVMVIDATQLTQRMGSQGAIDYLATATFSLTSRADISTVFFSFPVGDHATPGYYSRVSWISYYDNLVNEFGSESSASD